MNTTSKHPCPECICLPICKNKLNNSMTIVDTLDCKLFNDYFYKQISIVIRSSDPDTILNELYLPFKNPNK